MKAMIRALSWWALMTAPAVAPAAAMQAGPPTTPTFQLEVEGGPVWQSRNNVQIPNDPAGTRFSLVDAIGSGPWPAARIYATWNINNASYQFNSWRATYRYRFHEGDDWRWWIGFTAKVRDAKIRLAQGIEVAEKPDVGFVPL